MAVFMKEFHTYLVKASVRVSPFFVDELFGYNCDKTDTVGDSQVWGTKIFVVGTCLTIRLALIIVCKE